MQAYSNGARSASRPSTVASHYQAVERVILAMRERLEESLTLDDLAEIAIISPYYFDRIFRQITGIPPCQFLAVLRMEAAKRLLLTSSLSVTDICFEVGYNSLGTFITRFKQLVGLSPSHLRRLANKIDTDCLDQLCEQDGRRIQLLPKGSGITGRIGIPEGFAGMAFVGLFPASIPQSKPLSCSLQTRSGFYHLPAVADGSYYILASAFPWSDDPMRYLLPESAALLVGASRDPIVVHENEVSGELDITLRPAQLMDPPILISLPFLVAASFEKLREKA